MSLIQNLVPLGTILRRHYPGSLGQKVYPTVFLVELGHIGVLKIIFYDLIKEEIFTVIQTLRTSFYQEEILRSKFLVMLNSGLDRITVSNVRQVLIMHSREIYFALPVTLDFIARILECLERV